MITRMAGLPVRVTDIDQTALVLLREDLRLLDSLYRRSKRQHGPQIFFQRMQGVYRLAHRVLDVISGPRHEAFEDKRVAQRRDKRLTDLMEKVISTVASHLVLRLTLVAYGQLARSASCHGSANQSASFSAVADDPACGICSHQRRLATPSSLLFFLTRPRGDFLDSCDLRIEESDSGIFRGSRYGHRHSYSSAHFRFDTDCFATRYRIGRLAAFGNTGQALHGDTACGCVRLHWNTASARREHRQAQEAQAAGCHRRYLWIIWHLIRFSDCQERKNSIACLLSHRMVHPQQCISCIFDLASARDMPHTWTHSKALDVTDLGLNT